LTGSEWTCARCGLTTSFINGLGDPMGLPPNWEALDGIYYCLGCRRKLAGETRAAALPEEDSPAKHVRADAEGRIEFELDRDPDRCDTRVARACGTNVVLVRQVRERLGVYPTRPV
jgi:hypothetical protein